MQKRLREQILNFILRLIVAVPFCLGIADPSKEALKMIRKKIAEKPFDYSLLDRKQLARAFGMNGDYVPQTDALLNNKADENYNKLRGSLSVYEQKAWETKFGFAVADYGFRVVEGLVIVGTSGSGTGAAELGYRGVKKALDHMESQMNAENEAQLRRAATIHLSRMDRGSLMSDAEAEEEIFNKFGANSFYDKMPDDLKRDIQNNPTLRETFENSWKKRVQTVIAASIRDYRLLDGRVEGTETELENLKKDVGANFNTLFAFKKEAQIRLQNLEKAQRDMSISISEITVQVRSHEERLNSHESRLQKNTQDLNFIRGWMSGKMSAAELVEASKQGFMSLSPKDFERYQFLAKVDRFEKAASSVLNMGSDFLKIAEGLGVNPKVINKVRGSVVFASKTLELGTSFARGDIAGCIKSIASFFGGKDQNQVNHEEVMNTLASLQENQFRIMEGLSQISDQIVKLHLELLNVREEIFAKLDKEFARVNVNSDSIRQIITDINLKQQLGDCQYLQNRLIEKNPANPEFLSEKELETLMSASEDRTKAMNCRDGFYSLFLSRYQIHPLFIHGSEYTDRSSDESDRRWNQEQDFLTLKDLYFSAGNWAGSYIERPESFLPAFWLPAREMNTSINRYSQKSQLKGSELSSAYFANKLQPKLLAEVSELVRKSVLIVDRVVNYKFVAIDELASEETKRPRALLLTSLKKLLEHLQAAAAQERFISGSQLSPAISHYLKQSFDKESDEFKKLDLLFKNNPLFAHNFAVFRIREHLDALQGFQRSEALARNERIPDFVTKMADEYALKYEDGKMSAMELLMPSGWEILCHNDLKTTRPEFGWGSKSCPDSNKQKPRYYARVNGSWLFALPPPASIQNEQYESSMELDVIENEIRKLKELIVDFSPINERFVETEKLKEADSILFGGEFL